MSFVKSGTQTIMTRSILIFVGFITSVITARWLGPEGVGILEAHRGILFHHYVTDRKGITTDVNLIVATVSNNEAINRSVNVTAKELIVDAEPAEGLLNRLEMIVRAYDPCFSCATHVLKSGAVATEVKVIDHKGSTLKTLRNWEE